MFAGMLHTPWEHPPSCPSCYTRRRKRRFGAEIQLCLERKQLVGKERIIERPQTNALPQSLGWVCTILCFQAGQPAHSST